MRIEVVLTFGKSKHRSLDEGLGFHTYISCDFEGDFLSVTSYLNPEVYRMAHNVYSQRVS